MWWSTLAGYLILASMILMYFTSVFKYYMCIYVGYACNIHILYVVSAYLMNTITCNLNHICFSVMLSISHHLSIYQYRHKSNPLSLTSCKTVWRNVFLCLDAYLHCCNKHNLNGNVCCEYFLWKYHLDT